MPDYCVVCRAQAGVRFGKGDPLVLNQFRTVFGPVDVVLKTRIVPHEGFTKPVPMGLLAEVRGSAPSLDQALEEFSKVVRSICPVLVYIANSPIEEMLPEIGFETTNGIAEREFFQQFIGEEVILPIQRRRIPSDLATRILQAVFTHVESERIRRAIGQYYQALRNWEPGNESLALAHLWMGVEAFTPVVVRRVLEQEGATRTELAAAWAVEARNLEAEVRKRLILRGDTESYSKARMASDGLEHV